MDCLLEIETENLFIRRLTLEDATFMFQLMNDAAWLRYIGDRGINTIADAADYIENGPLRMYRDYGFGILVVERKSNKEILGSCGLLQREQLPYPDLGFAFLPQARGIGAAKEASTALLNVVQKNHLFPCIEAITSPDNSASIGLLTKLGFDPLGELPDFDKNKKTIHFRRTFDG